METTHKLEFEARPWHRDPSKVDFKVGTCHGLSYDTPESYIILAIINNDPGNGHFQDVLEWFYESCRRDERHLIFQEMMNPEFERRLIVKYGFKPALNGGRYVFKCYWDMK